MQLQEMNTFLFKDAHRNLKYVRMHESNHILIDCTMFFFIRKHIKLTNKMNGILF